MDTTLKDRTILPDENEHDQLESLREILASGGPVIIGAKGGASAPMPADICSVLSDVIDALSSGSAISVIPRDLTLTTQRAADLLNISRPTLVELLESGKIPFEKPGRHRRVKLRDVLDYKREMSTGRRQALNAATADSADEILAGLAEN